MRVLTLRLRPALGAAVWTQGKMAQLYPPTIPITIRTTLTKLTRLKWKQDSELRYPSLILIWSLLQIANMTTAKVKLYRKIYCEASGKRSPSFFAFNESSANWSANCLANSIFITLQSMTRITLFWQQNVEAIHQERYRVVIIQ